MVIIRRTCEEESKALLKIQQEAFLKDLEIYHDYDTNPAVEFLERLIRKINNFYYYTIIIDDEIAGGIDIRKISEDHFRINRIFLKLELQNKGYGTEIMKMIEAEFPQASKWSLETPFKNYRNHHFYEKLGYKKVSESLETEHLSLFHYIKEK